MRCFLSSVNIHTVFMCCAYNITAINCLNIRSTVDDVWATQTDCRVSFIFHFSLQNISVNNRNIISLHVHAEWKFYSMGKRPRPCLDLGLKCVLGDRDSRDTETVTPVSVYDIWSDFVIAYVTSGRKSKGSAHSYVNSVTKQGLDLFSMR